MDGFALVPDFDMGAAKAGVALSAELGARNIVCLLFDPDHQRGLERMAELAETAWLEGLGFAIEFAGISEIRSLKAAQHWLKRLAQPHAGVIVDILHLAQAGETPDDLAALPPRPHSGGATQRCSERAPQRRSLLRRLLARAPDAG